MKVYEDSYGSLPFWIIQVFFVLNLGLLGVYAWHTQKNGPSVSVEGLEKPTTLAFHENSEEYAKTISNKFVFEYMNWSYRNHMYAKRRAAYLCDEATGKFLVKASLNKQFLHDQLLTTRNARIHSEKVVWSDPDYNEYMFKMVIEVTEWRAHLEEKFYLMGWVEVAPKQVVTRDNVYQMEVINYNFEELILKNNNKEDIE